MSYFKATLLSSNSKANDLTETILKVINEKKPQSVKQLTIMLKESLDLEEKVILESVLKLQAEGVIKLEDQSLQSRSLATYLKTGEASWYWVTIAAGAITATLVFTISENFYPWVYVRNVFGVIFVLFLPGYAFIKALFPVNMLTKTSTKDLETIERIALSVGMSITLVSIVGLLLYYSPFGLDLTAIVLSLLAFTLVFATVAVARKYNIKRET
jgi:ribosomal silencing factor RsfS